MTYPEAILEAQRRWGRNARCKATSVRGPVKRYCRVGVYVPDWFQPSHGKNDWRGKGESWEAAFKDADEKAKEVRS